MKKVIVLVILTGLIWGGWRFYRNRPAKAVEVSYRSQEIVRGDITQEVTATGTVQPIKEVEVATQVTGKVISLRADFNSHVKAGDIIATIDPDTYKSALESAEAQLASNQATLERTKAQLILAKKTLERKKKLFANGGKASEAEVDSAQAEYDGLVASEKANQAAIRQSTASVKTAKTNLSYCTITSPVTGIVIKRAVDEGQTVVSSMNASSLFTIATDLTRIQVEAAIPEADVGGIREGQEVIFTVDAYKRKFKGKVTQIRLASTTTSNVVTYPVIVEAENPKEMLFPGMTANLSIIIEKVSNVPVVPAAAMRFVPPFAKEQQQSTKVSAGAKGGRKLQQIWIADSDTEIHPVEVKVGISDGVNQALTDGEALLGKRVVVGKMSAAAAAAASDKDQTSNPFMPKPPDHGKKKGGNMPPPN